jgi:hypothetical protein
MVKTEAWENTGLGRMSTIRESDFEHEFREHRESNSSLKGSRQRRKRKKQSAGEGKVISSMGLRLGCAGSSEGRSS